MKFTKLFKIVGILCLFLAVISFVILFLLFNSFEKYQVTKERQNTFERLGQELVQASDYLTTEARMYATTRNEVHFDNYWKEVKEVKTRDSVVAKLVELGLEPEELDIIERAHSNSNALITIQEVALNAVKNNNIELARDLLFSDDYEQNMAIVYEPIQQFQDLMNSRSEKEALESQKQVYFAMWSTISIIVILVITTLITFVVFYKKVLARIPEINKIAEEVANGNFTSKRLDDKGKDEMSSLSRSINAMSQSLQEIIMEVKNSSDSLTTAAANLNESAMKSAETTKEISASINVVATGANSQEQNSLESAKSIEDMAVDIQKIAENFVDVTETASEMSTISELGSQAVNSTIAQMRSIEKYAIEISEMIKLLEKDSSEIAGIVQMITDISEHTNLLALNAAIEAARVGDAGKGFAVVAEEIRKLSDQTKTSALKINEFVSNIGKNVENAVSSIERNNENVHSGLVIINNLDETFVNILTYIKEVTNKIEDMSATSEEMSARAEEISSSVTDVLETATEVSNNADDVNESSKRQLEIIEEMASSSSALASMAEGLRRLVSRFTF